MAEEEKLKKIESIICSAIPGDGIRSYARQIATQVLFGLNEMKEEFLSDDKLDEIIEDLDNYALTQGYGLPTESEINMIEMRSVLKQNLKF